MLYLENGKVRIYAKDEVIIMNKQREATSAYIILNSIIFSLFVIIQSVQVIYTPHTFVRVINLITIIFLSSAIGAFIRELFILKKKKVNMN